MQLRDRKKLKRRSMSMAADAQQYTPAVKVSTMVELESLYLDRIVAPASVQHLIPVEGQRRNAFPIAPLSLRSKKKSKVWQGGTCEQQLQQMDVWFPNVSRPTHNMSNDVLMHDIASPAASRDIVSPSAPRAPDCSPSDIGLFSKLPGELRNRIYRLAILQRDIEDPADVKAEPGTCSQGICLHNKLSYNVPGIANTCRQMRWEALPIFCAENKAIRFDDDMVHQCCVGNFLRNIGSYADLIPEFQFVLKRPIWEMDSFREFAMYTFALIPPQQSKSDTLDSELSTPDRERWTLLQSEAEGRSVCQCALDDVIDAMNSRLGSASVGREATRFADSEEFADFVWRMRKTKQWPHTLAKCKTCLEVKFNN